MDARSMASTINCSNYLWNYHPLHNSDTTQVADNTPHQLHGIGYLKIPILGHPDTILVCTFYMPSLPATIISPSSIASNAGCLCYSSFAQLDGQSCCLTLHGCCDTPDITFPLHLQQGLLYTQTLKSPPAQSKSSSIMQCTCSNTAKKNN